MRKKRVGEGMVRRWSRDGTQRWTGFFFFFTIAAGRQSCETRRRLVFRRGLARLFQAFLFLGPTTRTFSSRRAFFAFPVFSSVLRRRPL